MRMYERLTLQNEMSRVGNLASATNDPFEKKNLERQLDALILKGHKMDITNEFRGIKKDFSDTTKPYKSFFYIFRELYRPLLQGLYNIFMGLYFVNIVVLAGLIFMLGVFTPPSVLLYAAVVFMMPSLRSASMPFYFSGVRRSLWDAICIEGLILAGSVVSLLRGITQIISWPLFLLRIPFRGLITLFNGGFPKIEDNKGLRSLVAQSHRIMVLAAPENQKVLTEVLLSKLLKGRQWGQKTNIPSEATGDMLEKGDKSRFLMQHDSFAVIGLFRRAAHGRLDSNLDYLTQHSRRRSEYSVPRRRSASFPGC